MHSILKVLGEAGRAASCRSLRAWLVQRSLRSGTWQRASGFKKGFDIKWAMQTVPSASSLKESVDPGFGRYMRL